MIRLKEKYAKAIKLRKRGFSLAEITKQLNISKSTASLWARDADLPLTAIKRLASRGLLGKVRSIEARRKRRKVFEGILKKKASKLLRSTTMKKGYLKISCALLFSCEGTKDTRNGMCFVNSDPILARTFLLFLRSSFKIQEEKFRVCLHLHEYHSPKKQILFWSGVTGIPKSQFIKPYRKPHTAKRIKKDYPGCASIRYRDSSLAKELSILAKSILDKYGRVR